MKAIGFRSTRRAASLLVPLVVVSAAGCSSNPAADAELVAAPAPAPALESGPFLDPAPSGRPAPVIEPAASPPRALMPRSHRRSEGLDYVDLDDDHEEGWAAEGLWVGVLGGYSDVMDDFDGDVLSDPTGGTIIVPNIESDVGKGVQVSYRWYRHELVVAYTRFDFEDASFAGTPYETKFEYVDVLFRQYWLLKSPLQPYILAGLGYARAEAENAATDPGMTVTDDAVFRDGYSINLGIGLSFYPVPWVTVWGQGMYRINRFRRANGVAGAEFSDSVSAGAWEATAGASIRLLPPRP